MISEAEIKELHEILHNWLKVNKKTKMDVIAFLTSSWIGQMCSIGYDENFVDATLKRMKNTWLNHPSNIHKKEE